MFIIRYGTKQFCGSGMFIPDPNFFHPGSRIRIFFIPDPGFRIRIKEFKYFKLFLSSWKYDPGCSSQIRILIYLSIPDPGVKKAPDPVYGSATLLPTLRYVFVGMVCHVGKEEDRRSLIQATLDRFGGLDVLGGL